MATSGPYGSDRLGTSLTSFTSAPVPGAMQYRSQSRANRLPNWHVACCVNTRRTGIRRRQPAAHGCAEAFWGFEGPYGKDHTDHLQQELLVLVAARLAVGEILRDRVRGGRHRPRRCVGAGRNPAAVVLDPGAVPAP